MTTPGHHEVPKDGQMRSASSDDDRLIARYVEPNPNKPGVANARLKAYGVSVWALVGYFAGV